MKKPRRAVAIRRASTPKTGTDKQTDAPKDQKSRTAGKQPGQILQTVLGRRQIGPRNVA